MTIKETFKSSIRCGTGEAYLLIQKNPETDFSDEIIQAAVRNFAYDPQSEGDRAFYITGLMELSGRKEKISQAVLKALLQENENYWDLDQLFDIAAILAKQGDDKAKEAIYKRYGHDTDRCGDDAIVEIDGITGLKYIAEIRGKMFSEDKDKWDNSFFVDCFQEENPDINVYKELEKEAENNPYIKVYLETIAKYSHKKYKKKEQDFPMMK